MWKIFYDNICSSHYKTIFSGRKGSQNSMGMVTRMSWELFKYYLRDIYHIIMGNLQ
jgi:hypothetical protein